MKRRRRIRWWAWGGGQAGKEELGVENKNEEEIRIKRKARKVKERKKKGWRAKRIKERHKDTNNNRGR